MEKVKKRASKFIKRLAKKITDDGSVGDVCDKRTLKSLFADALSGLPQGDLKDEIQKNTSIYKRKLKLKLKSLTKVSTASSSEFPFNLYIANKHENIGANSSVDNLFLVQALASKNVDKLVKILKNLNDEHIELRLLSITSGDRSLAVLEKIMHVYFLRSQPVVDRLLEQKKPKRCMKMAEEFRHFLRVCHLRRTAIGQSSTSAVFRYEDQVAALAAVYVDLCLAACRTTDKANSLSRRLCKTCCYLTFGQPEFRLDLLLQMEKSNADILLPFVRKTLWLKPRAGNSRYYLKYVLTVRQLSQKLQPSLPDDIIQKCRTVEAPKDFLDWLKEQNPTIMEEIPEDKKFKKTVVTNFLLDDLTEVTETMLLDILTANCKQGKVKKPRETTDKETPASTSAVPGTVGWTLDRGPAEPAEDSFYIDTKGSGLTPEKDIQNADDDQKEEENDEELTFLYEEQLELEDEEVNEEEDEESDDDAVMVTDPLDVRDDTTSSLVEKTQQEVQSMIGRSQKTLCPGMTSSSGKRTGSEKKSEHCLDFMKNSKSKTPSAQQKKLANRGSKPKSVTKTDTMSEKLKETKHVKQSLFREYKCDTDIETELFDLIHFVTEPSIENRRENQNHDMLILEDEEMSDSVADKSDLSVTGVEQVSDSADSDQDDTIMFLSNLSEKIKSDPSDVDMSAVLQVVDKSVAKSPKKKAKFPLSPIISKSETSSMENTPSTADCSSKDHSVDRKLRKTKEVNISQNRTPSGNSDKASSSRKKSSTTSKTKCLSQAKIEMFYSSKSSLSKPRNDSCSSSGDVITIESDTDAENRRRTRSQFQSEVPCTEGVSGMNKIEETLDVVCESRDTGKKSVKKTSQVKIDTPMNFCKVDDIDHVDGSGGSYSLRKRQNSESSNLSLSGSVPKSRKSLQSRQSITTPVTNRHTPSGDEIKKSVKKRTSEQADVIDESEDSEITFKIPPVKKHKSKRYK